MGGLPTGPGQRRERGFTVSRLRKMDEKRYYLHRVLQCTNQGHSQDLISFSKPGEVVRVDITPPFYTGEN